MKFAERMLPALSRLAHRLIDAELFGSLESISNFATALQTGAWEKLADDERLVWLEQLRGMMGIRGLGDSGAVDGPELDECTAILDAQIKATRRRA